MSRDDSAYLREDAPPYDMTVGQSPPVLTPLRRSSSAAAPFGAGALRAHPVSEA
jgi:hypothetical protein